MHYNDVIMEARCVSNHQPHDCLLNRLFRRRSKKISSTSKLRVNGRCEGNLPVTGEFPAQRASNAENVSIWWRHHVVTKRSPEFSVGFTRNLGIPSFPTLEMKYKLCYYTQHGVFFITKIYHTNCCGQRIIGKRPTANGRHQLFIAEII